MAGSASQDSEDGITGINVTPLVDITLVLLIIFMVTAKIMVTQSVIMDLPKAASATAVQSIFSVVLTKEGEMIVNSEKVAKDDALLPLAREVRSKNKDVRAVIKADSHLLHGRVMHVLDLLKQAGISKIAFGVNPIPASTPSPSSTP